MKQYCDYMRKALFDGEVSLYDYTMKVKCELRHAFNTGLITYSQWARLYYEYIG